VGKVKPGKWLHHLSYLLKMPLHATFSAGPMDRVYCLTLSPDVHSKLIGAYERRAIYEAMRFLIACTLGEHMTQTTLILMASKLKRRRVLSNTLLCRQGETSKNIYFVKSGKVKIVRDVVFHSPKTRYQNIIGNSVFREDPMNAKGYNRFD